MRKKLILVFIVLLGVVLLSGCSNDSDSLGDETAVLNTVKALEKDLDSVAINYFDAEISGDWSNDYNFGFEFSGVKTKIDNFNLFKNIFILAADSMKINSVKFDIQSPVVISGNKAQVNAELLSSAPEALSSGIKYNINIDLSKIEKNWFVQSFEIIINNVESLSQELGDVYGDGNFKIYYPIGDTWFEPNSGGFLDGGIKLNSNYYNNNQNFKVVSSIPKYSTLFIDKGDLNNIPDLTKLKEIISQKTEYKDEIKTLSENLLESLYGGDINITVKINDFTIESLELLNDSELLSDIKVELSPEIEASDYSVSINDKITLSYKIKILYKLSGETLYLAAYAGPEIYYDQDFAEQLISSAIIKAG